MTQTLYDQAVKEYSSRHLDAALELFRQYTGVAPQDPRGFVAVGVILQEQGQIAEAVEAYTVAVQLRDDSTGHLKLGRTLSQLRHKGRAGEEEQHYRRAIELDPGCGDAWYQLSDLQRDLGEYEKAIESAHESIQLAPSNLTYHYRLGLAYFFAGQDSLADRAFSESNRLAVEKWDGALDGERSGRHWFARPEQTTELLPASRGERYGQRAPNLFGQANWPLPQLLYQQQSAYLVELQNVYLEGLHGLVYDDQRMFATQHVKIQGVWRYFVQSKPKLPRETMTLAKVASLHQPDVTNYYHWMVECLMRLLLLEPTLEQDPEIVVLTPRRGKCEFIDQSLELMGLSDTRRVENRANRVRRYFAETLYYVDWQGPLSAAPSAELAATWYPPKEGLQRLRTRLSGAPLPADERKLIIYVRRGPDEARKVTGDAGLIEEMQRVYGDDFVIFSAEHLSVADQIALFRKARLVFGPHGAGFTNLLFCAPGTVVIEFPVVPAVLNHFAHLAMALDHSYWIAADITAHYGGHFVVDDAASKAICAQIHQHQAS